jgi:hypothetical protein
MAAFPSPSPPLEAERLGEVGDTRASAAEREEVVKLGRLA